MGVEFLVERVSCGPVGRIDAEAGILYDVKVLGPESLNRRLYPRSTIERARGLYEGKKVNVDHPAASQADSARSIDDTCGWLQEVRVAGDSLRGDLHLLKSDPRAPKILEVAQRNPSLFGLSHNVEGKVRRDGDSVIVEEILRVRSVDIVSDPATTRSLFESLSHGREDVIIYPATATDFVRTLRGGSANDGKRPSPFATGRTEAELQEAARRLRGRPRGDVERFAATIRR